MAAEGETELDIALRQWRQGDFALANEVFFHLADARLPLTDESRALAEESGETGFFLAEVEIRGFVILTQTCDLVRDPQTRPYVEIAPLVEVPADQVEPIAKGKFVRYGYVPGAAERGLVADLDRVMTVEKAVLMHWPRQAGCSTDGQIQEFGAALARKRQRFAFPDDFVLGLKAFRTRLTSKHGKDSDEGRVLRGLREIRVRVAPSWDAPEDIELTFFFVLNDPADQAHRGSTGAQAALWIRLVELPSRFLEPTYEVVSLEDISAAEYLESAQLDLDHLSR